MSRSSPSSSGRKPWRSSTRSSSEADAVMVARGDLGLELPLERVPRVQKDVTRRARALGIPGDRRHAGARVDAHRAAADARRGQRRRQRRRRRRRRHHAGGRDGVGLHPVRAVQTLDADHPRRRDDAAGRRRCRLEATRVCSAATAARSAKRRSRWPQRGDATAIVAMTRGGKTARLLSALRPRAPIFAATDQPDDRAAPDAGVGRGAGADRSRAAT